MLSALGMEAPKSSGSQVAFAMLSIWAMKGENTEKLEVEKLGAFGESGPEHVTRLVLS